MGQGIAPEKKKLLFRQLEASPRHLVADHVNRLDSDYFHQFTVTEIREHLKSIEKLQGDTFALVRLVPLEKSVAALTVVGFDNPGFFCYSLRPLNARRI